MSELDEITLTPVLKLWRPRVNRDHPVTGRLIQAIRRWHEKRMAGKAHTNPSIEIDYDPARQLNEVFVYWDEADLPPGYEGQRFVIPREAQLELSNASWKQRAKELKLVWEGMNQHLARTEALETQVPELQDWVRAIDLGALHEAMQDVTPETHGRTIRIHGT